MKAESRPRLVCVDDDATIRAAVSRLLQKDFEILNADSGEAALKILQENPGVAIVLADQKMGGMTGLDLLTKVQEFDPDIVRVVFSGQIEVAEMAQAINSARIHRFIYKPWDNDYLRVQMFEALATHQTLRERRILENMSVTDALTQTKNRRYFHDRLHAELERSVRHGGPLSLVMIDIDHFKNFNDEYGHQAGDKVLRSVSSHLASRLRSMDTIARYGGEEFALILPDTSFEEAMKVAERLRLSLAERRFSLEGGPEVQVTVSLGIASHPQHAVTTEALVARADANLYQAKGQGRNQSVGGS